MNEKKKKARKKEEKKNKTFLIVAQVHLGFLLPFASLGVLLSPSVSPACSLCMQQQWQPTGADIFLKQPPGCCVWGRLSSARLGSTVPPPGIQGQGDCTSAIWTHNFAGLRVSFAAASHSSPACLVLLHLSRKAVTLMKNSIVSGSLHIHIAVRKVLS